MSQTLPPELFTLASKIQVHFSLEDMRQLCFALHMDHENVSGATRQEKAREIVLYFHHRVEIPRLLAEAKKARPKVNFTEDLTITAIAQDLPVERQRELEYLLEQLKATYEELIEWKEVHNKLDKLSNQIYGLYVNEVESNTGKLLNTEIRRQLLNAWERASVEIKALLDWVIETEYIGRNITSPFPDNQRWFRSIQVSHDDVLDCLNRGSAAIAGQSKKQLIPTFFRNNDPLWESWWLELDDLSRKLGSELKLQLSRADSKLLQVANDLSRQSEKFAGIRGYERI